MNVVVKRSWLYYVKWKDGPPLVKTSGYEHAGAIFVRHIVSRMRVEAEQW